MMRLRSGWVVGAMLLLSGAGLIGQQDRGVAARPTGQAAPGGEKRAALVIGNGAYDAAPLRNPVNDARAMAAALREAGFDVTPLENADQRAMEEGVRTLAGKLAGGGVGLFYFAGHGVQVAGRNYLVPVGSRLESEADARYRALDAGWVLESLAGAGARVSVLILDACRDNPFTRSFRSAGRGLAALDAPAGTLVAYATAPGSVAADGSGENGVFTGALVRHIRADRGVDVEALLRGVSAEVQQATGGKQVPFRSSSLTGDFYFHPPAGPGPAAGPGTAAGGSPPVTVPPPPPVVGGLNLGDLEKNAQVRAQWGEYQSRMATDGAKVTELEGKMGLTAAEKATAWERFLGAYGADNPFSAEDETLRTRARDRLAYWKAQAAAGAAGPAPAPEVVTVGSAGPAGQVPPPNRTAGDVWKDPLSGVDFVWIPEGEFWMGSPDNEKDRGSDEGPRHRVRLTKGFWLGRTVVTQGQWQAVMGSNPSYFKNGNNYPVEQVSWDDCQEYIRTLNSKAGGNAYRLPTEAEWEYACRAITTTAYHFSDRLDSSQANFDGNFPYGGAAKGVYRQKTAPVMSCRPNAWGLYDMHGNVWEWCQDWYGENYFNTAKDGVNNPKGPDNGNGRLLRGGSWLDGGGCCRSAFRDGYRPADRSYTLGLRLARDP